MSPTLFSNIHSLHGLRRLCCLSGYSSGDRKTLLYVCQGNARCRRPASLDNVNGKQLRNMSSIGPGGFFGVTVAGCSAAGLLRSTQCFAASRSSR